MKPDSQSYESIQARLQLRAVLPTLSALLEIDEDARKIAGPLNLNLRFKSLDGCEATLRFENGKLSVDPDAPTLAPLTLFFASDKQVNKLFLNQGLPLVFPNWRIWKLPKMLRFKKLSKRMENILKTDPAQLRSNLTLLQTHIHLLIGSLIPLAFVELARNEDKSKELLSVQTGLIQLLVANTPIQSWIDCQGPENTKSGSGLAPRAPDLVITFRDLETALLSTRNELDALAATSGGDIKLEGNIPLGDAANAVLDRIGLYLKV